MRFCLALLSLIAGWSSMCHSSLLSRLTLEVEVAHQPAGIGQGTC